jgi:uncharacterized sulfatase
MRTWRIVAIGLALCVVVGIVAGSLFRDELMLEMVGVTSRLRTPVGPHREIEWSRGPDARAPGRDQPNVVLILADDLGWNDLTFGGGGVAGGSVPTPHIDSIAADGVQFTRGYAAHATCAPSRAALMTGRYPTRFGFEFTPTPPAMLPIVARLGASANGPAPLVTHFDEHADAQFDYEDMGVPPSEITIAELLARAGYHNVHIGKWHLGRSGGMAPHDQGFDESLLMHSGLYLREDDPGVVNSKQPFDPIDRFLWKGLRWAASFNGGDAFEPGGYLTDYYTEEAVKVIEANRNRPFFLYLAHWAPHTPLQATREDYAALSHIEDHRLRVYAAMIRALDRGVGRVLDALEANGLAENTLVIFTSDNGGAGYIGLPDVNQPYRGWKMTFFEGGIRVPFFMRWPARIAPGQRIEAPVHHFDLFATAAAAAGVAPPADREIDGVDLLPWATGEIAGRPHDRLFWRSGHYEAALVGNWKLQRAGRPDRVWLHDLAADPTERHDVAGDHASIVGRIESMLAIHDAEQAEPMWPALIEAPTAVDKTSADAPAPGDEYVYWPN